MNKTMCPEDVQEIVNNCRSMRQFLIKIDRIPAGGNYETFKKFFKKTKIDISHFKGQGWSKGLKGKSYNKKPLKEILKKGVYYPSHKLKIRLIKKGLKIERCEKCGLDTWLNNPIPLELNHINGKRSDNQLENLELLCPNCHALTPNYRGKNIKAPC